MSTESLVRRWVREPIQKLDPYPVPDASGMVKLDAMENPYSLPEPLKSEWLNTMGEVSLNRYPDAQATALRKKLVEAMDLPEGV